MNNQDHSITIEKPKKPLQFADRDIQYRVRFINAHGVRIPEEIRRSAITEIHEAELTLRSELRIDRGGRLKLDPSSDPQLQDRIKEQLRVGLSREIYPDKISETLDELHYKFANAMRHNRGGMQEHQDEMNSFVATLDMVRKLTSFAL